jgi:riboflavin synthase
MFTGIIEEIGNIADIKKWSNAFELTIEAKIVLQNTKIGNSIAVNGVCLTVTRITQNQFTVDIMPETYKVTSLAQVTIGSRVNLERAMVVGNRIDGHFVSGHVDGTATIKEIIPQENAVYYTIALTRILLYQCINRGSIAVDGTSLTIFGIVDETITVALIPHTVTNSILGQKKVGDIVNIECDMLGKYVANYMLYQK